MKISISGIRGVFGEDLTLQEIARFSRSFGSYIKDNTLELSCVIARDSRPSGKMISDVVTSCLLEQGIDVYDLDIAPTPVLFRESRKYSASLMITASHNPLPWNGLKMLIRGRGLFEEELNQFLKTKIHDHSKIGKYYKIHPCYIRDLLKCIPPANLPNSNFKAGLDPGGGAACNYVNHLFESYNINYLGINDRYGFSTRSPDPTSDPLLELRELVKINKLNFGFAFDTDGDRLVLVNNDGNKLTPDLTLLLCIASVIQHNKFKKFAISLDSSQSIVKYVKDRGGQLFLSKIGESNVIKTMSESNCESGGEGSSGGFIMPSFTSCRDGLLASILVSSLDNKIVNECMMLSSEFNQIRTKISLDNQINVTVLFEKIISSLKSLSTEIIDLDGLKFIFDENSWVLIRLSNTEHVLRVSLESTKEKADPLYRLIHDKIINIYEKI